MSATYGERVFRWGMWLGTAFRKGWTVVGFYHHCGAATIVDFSSEYDGSCCSGCRFEIARPADECEPLYQPIQSVETVRVLSSANGGNESRPIGALGEAVTTSRADSFDAPSSQSTSDPKGPNP